MVVSLLQDNAEIYVLNLKSKMDSFVYDDKINIICLLGYMEHNKNIAFPNFYFR